MNELDFSGKQVLVVGGSSGIGNGIAQGFRAKGARVHVSGTRAAASDYTAEDGSHLDGLHFMYVPDDNTRVSMLQAGEIDACVPVPAPRMAELKTAGYRADCGRSAGSNQAAGSFLNAARRRPAVPVEPSAIARGGRQPLRRTKPRSPMLRNPQRRGADPARNVADTQVSPQTQKHPMTRTAPRFNPYPAIAIAPDPA